MCPRRCRIVVSVLCGAFWILSGCGRAPTPSSPNATDRTSQEQHDRVAVSFSAHAPAPLAATPTSPKSDSAPKLPLSTAAETSEFGRISGVVKWTGPVPQLERIPVTKDAPVCAEHGRHDRPSDRLIVGLPSGGVKNAVVYLFGTFENGKPLTALQHPDELNQRQCSYDPRVMVVPVGYRLPMTSEDETLHNIHMAGAAEMNLAISKGGRTVRGLERTGIVQLTCDVHPWMSGYIHVVKHPYYAVTNADGRFELADVPAGVHEIRLWHEPWWRTEDRFGEPLLIKRTVTVTAGSTTEVTFELSDPAQARLAGRPSNRSASKR